MKFCPQCGTRCAPEAKFCTECGTQITPAQEDQDHRNLVRVPAAKRRVRPGELAAVAHDLELADEWDRDIWVEPDSLEAQLAAKPFIARTPPGPNDRVPVNCVWAVSPHPGRAPDHLSGSLSDKFGALGVLQGRTRAEITALVGPPSATSGSLTRSLRAAGSTV